MGTIDEINGLGKYNIKTFVGGLIGLLLFLLPSLAHASLGVAGGYASSSGNITAAPTVGAPIVGTTSVVGVNVGIKTVNQIEKDAEDKAAAAAPQALAAREAEEAKDPAIAAASAIVSAELLSTIQYAQDNPDDPGAQQDAQWARMAGIAVGVFATDEDRGIMGVLEKQKVQSEGGVLAFAAAIQAQQQQDQGEAQPKKDMSQQTQNPDDQNPDDNNSNDNNDGNSAGNGGGDGGNSGDNGGGEGGNSGTNGGGEGGNSVGGGGGGGGGGGD